MSVSQTGDKPANTSRALLRRRWVQALIAVLGLVVAVRVALPYAARRIAIQQVDELLVGRADVADIDFELLKGVVTLHGLRVYAHDAAAPSDAVPAEKEHDAPEAPQQAASPAAPAGPTEANVPAAAPPTTLHANRAVAPKPSSPAATPAPPAADEPMLSAARVSLNVGWLALFKKLVDVQAFEIDTFDVHLDRARDGALVLPQPVPSTEPPPPAEEKEEGSGWGVLIERVTLRSGEIAFRDYAVSETPETIVASIPNLDADHLALLITDTGMRPGKMVLDAALEDGTLRLESSLQNVEGGTALESHLVLANLPIGDARSYIPKVGWTSLDGRLDIDLIHRFDPGTNAVRGTAALRDAKIGVDGVAEPALSLTKLAVGIDALDLVKQDAKIGTVTIDGLHVIAEPAGPEPLPLLRGLVAKTGEAVADTVTTEPPATAPQAQAPPATPQVAPPAASEGAAAPAEPAAEAASANPDAQPAPAPPAGTGDSSAQPAATPPAATGDSAATPPASGDSAPPPAASPPSTNGKAPVPPAPKPAAHAETAAPKTPPAPPQPWTWSVQRVVVNDSSVKTLGGDGPLEVKVRAEATPISSKLDDRTKIDVTLSPAQGTLNLNGDMVIEPLAFDGKLHVDALALPPLTQPVATPITRLLNRATLATDLGITLGAGTNAPNDGARVTGKISITDFEVAGDDPKQFAVRWTDFSIDASEILLPGILAKEPAAPQPISVALASLSVVRPKFVVLRTPQGINLPKEFTGASSAPAETAPAEEKSAPVSATQADTAPPASAPVADAAAGEPAAGAAPISVRVDQVSIAQLRVTITDKSVEPVYHSSIDPLDLKASDVRWPGPYAKDIDLKAKGLDGAILKVAGQLSPEGSQINGTLDGLPLSPLDPYAVAAGYGLGGGTASLRSRVTTGPSSYSTKNRITVNRLALTGTKGDSLFAAQFGMPLSLALSLMTDLQGNIVLSIPIGGDRSGTRIAIGSVIRDALAKAILNAATSPLKLIGAVANIGEKPASLVPPPLAFQAGRAVLVDGDKGKLEQLAKLLEKSPNLKLEVRGEASDADSRWIAEQALRAKLEDESGILGALRHPTERGEREKALEVLEARAEGKTADMPAEYQAWFDEQVARFPVTDEKLFELATERANWVRSELAKDDATAARVSVIEANPEDLASRSVVALTFATPSASDDEETSDAKP